MMIFNPKKLKSVPYVAQGNVAFGAAVNDPKARAQLHAQAVAAQNQARQRQAAAVAHAKNVEYQAALTSQKNAAMLARSLKQSNESRVRGVHGHTLGFVDNFGVRNPLLGFVDENTESDYVHEQVIPAQEFSNRVASKDFPSYTKFQDYPHTIDSPAGDFGGVLLTEGGSADFAHLIVNDAAQDFGSEPNFGIMPEYNQPLNPQSQIPRPKNLYRRR